FGWISPDENPKGLTNSWNEREDDYSSVAFWYQEGTPTFEDRAPDGAARRLPSLERVLVKGTDVKTHGAGEAGPQQLDLYMDPQLPYKPTSAEGAWIDIPFDVEKKEPLRLLLNMTTSYDFGTYQAYIVPPGLSPAKGYKLGDAMDFYSSDVANREF